MLGFVGCPEEDKGGGVDYTNFAPYSIKVENLTGEKLVAFKNGVNPNNLISGVPAYSGEHGLKRDTSLFSSNQTVVLHFITEAEYNKNKNALTAAPVFTKIFAFYNHTGTNNNVFEISSSVGGQGRLNIVNDLLYNIEIRDGGPTGPVLGYAAAMMTSGNELALQFGDYEVYPVYKFYHPIEQELYSVIPRFTEGNLANKPYFIPFGISAANPNRNLNIADIENEGSPFKLSAGGIYLRIDNQSSVDVRMWNSTTPMYTNTAGIEYFPSGTEAMYNIPFTRNTDGTYPATRTISTLRIGAGSNMINVTSTEFELDYNYTITVTGSTASTLTIGDPVKGNPVDIEAMIDQMQ